MCARSDTEQVGVLYVLERSCSNKPCQSQQLHPSVVTLASLSTYRVPRRQKICLSEEVLGHQLIIPG